MKKKITTCMVIIGLGLGFSSVHAFSSKKTLQKLDQELKI